MQITKEFVERLGIHVRAWCIEYWLNASSKGSADQNQAYNEERGDGIDDECNNRCNVVSGQ